MARIRLEWSADALADLDRFAAFLAEQHPRLAPIVARSDCRERRTAGRLPGAGRPILDRPEYRQLVLRVLKAHYVFQYRYDGQRMVMLRVFHGREDRSTAEAER